MKQICDFSSFIQDNTLITGGHFTLTQDYNSINDGTIASFRNAVEHYSKAKPLFKNVSLGILINDIGSICSGSSCSVVSVPSKENFILPDIYRSILNDFYIKEEELIIFWEKHMRNRAKKMLHKALGQNHPHIFYVDGGYVYRCPLKNVEILLTRYSKQDKRGTPACPLIMSAFASEQMRNGFSSSFNFYYVGEDNYTNVANHFIIEKSKFLSESLKQNISIKNIYIFSDKVLKNF